MPTQQGIYNNALGLELGAGLATTRTTGPSYMGFTGQILFVQSSAVNASDANTGQAPGSPKKTLQGALNTVIANNGDVIYCLPGHNEVVTAAAGLTFASGTADGVTVFFMGAGADRAGVTLGTATTASITIPANNVTLIGMKVTAALDAIATAISITGSDCTLENVEYYDATSILTTIQVITTNAAKRLTINGYTYYVGTAGTTSTEAIRIVGGDHHRLENLNITGAFSTSAFNNVTTATTNFVGRAWYLNNTTLTSPASAFVSTSTFAGQQDVSPQGGTPAGPQVISKILALPASATTQTVFTITGGPIFVEMLGGIVTTTIGSTATTLKFSTVNTIGTLDLNTAGTITSLAVNDIIISVTSTGTALNVASTAGFGPIAASTLLLVGILAPGTIIITTSANAGGGAFQYFMRYRTLGNNVVVS